MIKIKTIFEEWIGAKANYLNNVTAKKYYDCEEDAIKREEYYARINFNEDHPAHALHSLLKETHTSHLSYSPHRYVYPWVDLQENRKLKSLYSGQHLDPLKTIEEDLMLIKLIQESSALSNDRITFNCEHVVPQSWFDENQPMKGDLHHLFACEPACNSMRSNYPYYDFTNYPPPLTAESIRTGCGMSENERFEPEYGKGIAARAVFYFSIRYQDVVALDNRMDLTLLLKWNHDQPVTLYEKHRNAAIQELQGNRNPFIDFPEAAERILGI